MLCTWWLGISAFHSVQPIAQRVRALTVTSLDGVDSFTSATAWNHCKKQGHRKNPEEYLWHFLVVANLLATKQINVITMTFGLLGILRIFHICSSYSDLCGTRTSKHLSCFFCSVFCWDFACLMLNTWFWLVVRLALTVFFLNLVCFLNSLIAFNVFLLRQRWAMMAQHNLHFSQELVGDIFGEGRDTSETCGFSDAWFFWSSHVSRI